MAAVHGGGLALFGSVGSAHMREDAWRAGPGLWPSRHRRSRAATKDGSQLDPQRVCGITIRSSDSRMTISALLLVEHILSDKGQAAGVVMGLEQLAEARRGGGLRPTRPWCRAPRRDRIRPGHLRR